MAKKSNKLRGPAAAKVWKLARQGINYKEIGDEIGYTATAVKLFLRKKFAKEADKLWSAEILAVGHCEINDINCKGGLNAHHLIEKSTHPHLRYDLSNGICLCANHHTFCVEISPHRCPNSYEEFADWLCENRYGQWIWFQQHRRNKAYQQVDCVAAYFELKGK